MSRHFGLLTLALLLLASPMIYAVPVQVGQGAFTNPTILDFSTIGNEVLISNQFSGQGATFSGGIYGLTNTGDTFLFPGPPAGIASDWRYSQGDHGSLPITVNFSATETLVGFWDESNIGDTTTISLFLNGVPHGSVSLPSLSNSVVFFGVSDTAGFNSITIGMTGAANHFLGLDPLEFQGSTPEPSSFLLLGSGVLGLAGLLRRKINL